MANAKEGGKNKKIGRHARNASSKMQAKRTEANKKARVQKVAHIPSPYWDPKRDRFGNIRWIEITFHGKRERVHCNTATRIGV